VRWRRVMVIELVNLDVETSKVGKFREVMCR
jgi:hypothetical protein